MTLDEIGRLSGGRVMGDYLNTLITGISTDSRQAKAGDLFVALVGENSDGHDYVEKAIDKGASAAMVHANWYNTFLPTHGQFIVVDYSDRPGCDSPLLALGQLGENYRKRFDIPVVGITGSMGKTSTREILGTILRSRMNPLVSKANFNTEIGVPITLMDLTDANDVAVLEMAMRGLGQIEYLCKIAQPTAAIITNVGLSHIELLKTQDRT
ncbi:MAG: UDP-N-acetylmuramoyl-tripeptide--D-alanyl-D-alanine ligase, partial [Armatimonadota bacterium]